MSQIIFGKSTRIELSASRSPPSMLPTSEVAAGVSDVGEALVEYGVGPGC